MSEHDSETRGRGNKPVETLRDGALKVSIFRNSTERGESYAIVPGRLYTDKQTGEVREASSLGGGEPLRMAHLLTKGHDRVTELKALAKRGPDHSKRKDAPAKDRDTGHER